MKDGLDAMNEGLQQESGAPHSTHEFRCTRPHLYNKGSPGHRNHRDRQGHYVCARNKDHAHEVMRERFPDDEKFDVELWATFDTSGKQTYSGR